VLFSCVFLYLPVVIQSIQIRCSQNKGFKVTNLLILSPVSDVSQSVGSLCKFGLGVGHFKMSQMTEAEVHVLTM
jgi:hypothetical protein